jgi:hypothetical protein
MSVSEQLLRVIDDLGLADEDEGATSAPSTAAEVAVRTDKVCCQDHSCFVPQRSSSVQCKFVAPTAVELEVLTKHIRNLLKEGHGETILTLGTSGRFELSNSIAST